MRFSFARGSAIDWFSSLCLALLTSACLTPPAPKAVSSSKESGFRTAPLERAPREFSHSSMDLWEKLDLGWNLGNSLDVPEGETAWGNPVVTPQLLSAVATAGFDLVRIPVTWTPHTGPAPEYVIDGSSHSP